MRGIAQRPLDIMMCTLCSEYVDCVGCHMASSGGYWRHFYSDSESTAQCELFLTVPNRKIYLLTVPNRKITY